MQEDTDEEFLKVTMAPRILIADEMADIGSRLGDTFIAEGALTNTLGPTLEVVYAPFTTSVSSSSSPILGTRYL